MRDGRWEYTIKAYAGGKHELGARAGALVKETTHIGTRSRDMEIDAYRSRMVRGEISHIEVISHIEPYGTETIYK